MLGASKLPLSIDCDANDHHTLWGSSDVIQSKDDRLQFLISISTNLGASTDKMNLRL